MSHFRSHRRPAVLRRNLRLEGLDRRVLLAGLVTEVVDGVAMISGSPANDEIVIATMVQREEVHVFEGDECVSAWPRSDVREIDVQSLVGDDLIRVGDSVAVPVKVTGGSGLDTVLINNPHAHRHGWAFDVEQVMAEGEFSGLATVGQGDHAGHDMSGGFADLTLSPIPTDHVHVGSPLATLPEETPPVSQPDPTAGTSTVPSATPGLPREPIASEPSVAGLQPTSLLQREAGIDAVGQSAATTSTLAATSSAAPIGHQEHLDHGSSVTSASSVSTSAHAEHGGSTTATLDSSHAGHGGSTTSSLDSSHAGHGGHTTATNDSSHAGHGGHTTATNDSSHAGHGGHTTAANDPSHAGHGQHTTAANEFSHAGHGQDETFAIDWSPFGHDQHRTSSNHSSHAGHDQHTTSSNHSSHVGHNQYTTSSNHSSHAGHDRHGAMPVAGRPGETSSSACHASPEVSASEAIAQEQTGAGQEREDVAGQVSAESTPVEDRPTTMPPLLSRILAVVGAGTLLYVHAIRRRRWSTGPDSQAEWTPQLGFEWIGGYGVPNS
jgi:hypothetical protein